MVSMCPFLVITRVLAKALLLGVQPEGQQKPQGTSEKYRIIGLTPDLLNQNLYFNHIPICTLNVSTTPKCALERKHWFLEGLIGVMNDKSTAITTTFTTNPSPPTNMHTHKATLGKGSVLTHIWDKLD